jgi:hypothetical protein
MGVHNSHVGVVLYRPLNPDPGNVPSLRSRLEVLPDCRWPGARREKPISTSRSTWRSGG